MFLKCHRLSVFSAVSAVVLLHDVEIVRWLYVALPLGVQLWAQHTTNVITYNETF